MMSYNQLVVNKQSGALRVRMRAAGGTGTQYPISFNSTLTNPLLYINPNGNIGIGGTDAGATPKLFVNGTSGNVGIGTTSPSGLLNVRLNSSMDGINLTSSAANAGRIALGYYDGGYSQPMLSIYGRSDAGYTERASLRFFRGDTNAEFIALGATFEGHPSISAKSNFAVEIDKDNLGTGAFGVIKGGSGYGRIGTDGTTLFYVGNGGNVGIGTTGPAAKLDISSGTTPAIYIRSSSTTAGQNIQINNTTATYNQQIYGNDVYYDNTVAGAYIWRNNNGTENVRIAGGGNVGIGTTTVPYPLNVNGSISIADGVNGALRFDGANNDWQLYKSGNNLEIYDNTNAASKLNIGTGANGAFNFYNGTGAVIFNGTGNVGIGTTSPSAPLSVTSAAETALVSVTTGVGKAGVYGTSGTVAGYGVVGFNNSTVGVGVLAQQDSTGFALYSTGGKNYFSGNVGIGSLTPAQALDVNGRIAMATWTADGDTVAYRDTTTNSIALVTSDRRLKKNIVPLTGSLDIVNQLNTYKYNDLDEADGSKLRLGVMSQEVLPLIPELTYAFTSEGSSETYYGVHYDKLTVLLLGAMKEQQALINYQNNRILALENVAAVVNLPSISDSGDLLLPGDISGTTLTISISESGELSLVSSSNSGESESNAGLLVNSGQSGVSGLNLVMLADSSQSSTSNGRILGVDSEGNVILVDNPTGIADPDLPRIQASQIDGLEFALFDATASGDLRINRQSFFTAFVEFIQSVIFRGEVTFLGKIYFAQDMAGTALIVSNEQAVDVTFEKPYEYPPIVTISYKLKDATESAFLNQSGRAAVSDVTEQGFSIVLERPTTRDIEFTWVAIAVREPKQSKGTLKIIPSPTPTPSVDEILNPTNSTNHSGVEPDSDVNLNPTVAPGAIGNPNSNSTETPIITLSPSVTLIPEP